MGGKFSEFHAIEELTEQPDSNGISRDLFGVPRARAVAPTVLKRADGLAIALPTFEFGLVLAGAVSAGAYTAGVMDYLVETLDRWEARKRADFEAFGTDFSKWSVPPHAVRLTVAAGASAGSVAGAIFAACAHGSFPSGAGLSPALAPQSRHQDAAPLPPHENPFYNAWVRQIDIRPMLATDDLVALGDKVEKHPLTGRPLSPFMRMGSILNVRPLENAAAQTISLELPPLQTPRPWLDQGVKFAFTVGNLQGIPYRYQLVGLEGAQFATTRHTDLFHFTLLGAADGKNAFQTLIERQSTPEPDNWPRIANAALASAAFPLALQSRWIAKPAASVNLDVMLDPRLQMSGNEPPSDWTQPAKIVGGYVNTSSRDLLFSFAAVDGGTMNNQPFEYVRQTLAGPLGVNPRDGARANRAVVLIDPFPALPEPEQEGAPPDPRAWQKSAPLPIFEVLPQLFGAYTAQARYDANNLLLATDSGIYNRYMLSPMRADPTPGTWHSFTGADALASGRLGAFAGFLSESFRHHDFLLGRRNAENFLRNYFSLPADNPLFVMPGTIGRSNTSDAGFWADKGSAEVPAGPYWTITCDGAGVHERAIIPVPIERSAWPQQQPATGLAMLLESNRDRRTEMMRLRKLAVRDRLLCPSPQWPDPAGQAEPILKELEPAIAARARAIAGLAVRAIELRGLKGILLKLLRPAMTGFLATLASKKIKQAIHDSLSASN